METLDHVGKCASRRGGNCHDQRPVPWRRPHRSLGVLPAPPHRPHRSCVHFRHVPSGVWGLAAPSGPHHMLTAPLHHWYLVPLSPRPLGAPHLALRLSAPLCAIHRRTTSR